MPRLNNPDGAIGGDSALILLSAATFTVVRTAQTAAEADLMISALRGAGLHPVELSLSPHICHYGADLSFPVQVPAEEATTAREILKSYGSPEQAG